jgi:hypothetical protein
MKSLVNAAPLVLLGCSAMGGPPTTPVPWTPGQYSLEATVGETLSAEDVRAQLTIAPDSRISLASSTGLCRERDAAEVERDFARGRATFECGDATFQIRPIPGSVRGEVRASVLEEVREQTTCPLGRTPPCFIMRTQRVTRSADLRVNPVR